jgi:hypothetical protein
VKHLLLSSLVACGSLALGVQASVCASGAASEGRAQAEQPESKAAPATAPAVGSTDSKAALPDAPLDAKRRALIDLAFGAATRVPTLPHARTRTKLQDAVVEQCFALGQWQAGLDYCASIDDWRRGVLLLTYAEACLEHDQPAQANAIMEQVRGLAKSLADSGAQSWQVAKIQGRLGALQVRQGLTVDVDAGLLQAEKAEAVGMRRAYAAQVSQAEFEGLIVPLEAAHKDADFEDMLAIFAVCQELYQRFYGQPELRARVDKLLHDSWVRMPFNLRVEQLLGFAEIALDQGDGETALRHLDEADEILAETLLDMRIAFPLIGRLAADLHRVGQGERGQQWITKALAKYDAENPLLSQVFRAECLRPLAEAQVHMGRMEEAQLLYWRTVEVGAENINARPRVEDLVATCLSIVRTGFEAEDKLVSRLSEIAAGLEDPW